MACIRWSSHLQPLLGKIPSQQGIFPKIDYFPPTMKPHSLNLLTTGPPLLYWQGINRWCSGPCVLVLLSSALVFFHSHVILCLYLTTMLLAFLSLFIQPFWVFASFCYKDFIFLFLFLFLPSCLHNPQYGIITSASSPLLSHTLKRRERILWQI